MSIVEGLPDDPQTEEELAACLGSWRWRIFSGRLYKIMVKEAQPGADPDDPQITRVVPFIPNKSQTEFLDSLANRNLILKARQLGFCLTGDARVLTADLRWVRMDQIGAGTEIVACDEHPPGGRGRARKLRLGRVVAKVSMRAPCWRITFEDGRSVTCTDRHPWLSRKAGPQAEWRSVSGAGNEVVGRLRIGTEVRWVARPWDDPSVEDGWFGGMLDGEGSLSKSNVAASISVSQRAGAVWDRLHRYLSEREYNFRIEGDAAIRASKHGRVPVPKLVVGRLDEMFRLIGQTRPTRFIDRHFWDGRDLPGKRTGEGWSRIVAIESVGEAEVYDLQTTAGTYIAEGFVSHNTTAMAIVALDFCLFNADVRAAIIAQDKGKASEILRDKVLFAYQNLPDALRDSMPLRREAAEELLFAHNNSGVQVSSSARGGTKNLLHVSEMGKIGAKRPELAQEIVTGSLPSVPDTGIVVIESTAEGASGRYYEMAKAAQAIHQRGGIRNRAEYRFHFHPWWSNPAYRMETRGVIITPVDHAYFDKVEAEAEALMRRPVSIDMRQRAWYCATRDNAFSGDAAVMWQEHPSTPDEAFQQSLNGTYFARQLAAARMQGRIGAVPPVRGVQVNTFWDIGHGDGTAVWLHQQIAQQHRFIGFIEGWGEPFEHFIQALQSTGYLWGTHYLPHDAGAKKQLVDRVISTQDMLIEAMPHWRWEIVPRVQELQVGIQQTRAALGISWFDETLCKAGVTHLGLYRKQWIERTQNWSEAPFKDEHTEAADAFRQFAQAHAAGVNFTSPSGTRINRPRNQMAL